VSVQRPSGQAVGGPVWCEIERDAVVVTGPQAESYLQGQCSQDVAAVDTGRSAWTFLLQPTGKVEVLARITRTGDGFVLDTDGGFGDALEARLRRFLLRTKATVERPAWRCIAVRRTGTTLVTTNAALVASAPWHGLPGFDLFGPDPEPPLLARPVDRAAYARARVEAGWPAMGAELTSDTIPAESGVVREAASFSKGCYTGQELVARIDSRGGHVPRYLRHVRLAAAASVGAPVAVDAKVVGRLTSVAGDLALAYVARAVEPPAPCDLGTIEAIPGAQFVSA
jgi:folate-binding protein YgfZ